jgi:hypothetical protein
MTPDALAEHMGVDRKTCERWVTMGRVPYRRHRHAIAAMVRESESYLCPDALVAERRSEVARSEVVELFPHRSDVPADLWGRLLREATERVDVLVYAGLFLPEQNPRLMPMLTRLAKAGVQVRLLFGQPDAAPVAERGREEGIGDALAHKVRNVLVHYRALNGDHPVQLDLPF